MSRADRLLGIYVAFVCLFAAAICWHVQQPAESHADHDHAMVVGAAPRSGKWPTVRAAYLADHPTCEACGSPDDITVHHVKPLSFGGCELCMDNLITLCGIDRTPDNGKESRNCHLHIGHRGNWRLENPNVREDAAKCRRARK